MTQTIISVADEHAWSYIRQVGKRPWDLTADGVVRAQVEVWGRPSILWFHDRDRPDDSWRPAQAPDKSQRKPSCLKLQLYISFSPNIEKKVGVDEGPDIMVI